MKIVFGWHLDGPTCPETPDGGPFAIDAAVAGPLQFLDLLETRLGLNGPRAPAVLRIAQYLARLRAIDDGARFFSRSLAADGWATARLVLSWRDELVAAGWTSAHPAAAATASASWAGERLAAIALAEAQEQLPFALGLPDRARSILSRLHGSSPIDELTLVDDPQCLPLVWQRLIETLAAAGADVVRAGARPLAQANDLAAVQAMLADGERGKLSGDGSFSVVRCDDELVAGDIAAEWLAALPGANGDVAIIRQGDATILDGACRRLGLARPGGSSTSPLRGALQALPLAFETAWQPFDAERMLELLVMRGSPVPYRMGRYFADVLRDYPGTGGGRWQEAWQQAEEQLREERSDHELDDRELSGVVRKTLDGWREWLEPERFQRDSGTTAKAADAICRKVQRWALRRASATADSIFLDTANAAAVLADTIAASALQSIAKPQVDRMVDAVIAEGIRRPGTSAEAAPWTTVDDPMQIWNEVPSVLWWGFADPGSAAPRTPWTAAEQAELAAAGVALAAPGAAVTRHLEAQRRAILNAAHRVLLVSPAMAAAENAATHPLWHELAGLEGLHETVIDGRSLRRAAQVSLGGRAWTLAQIEPRPLPRPLRDWQVSSTRIGARTGESATSLESLLGCPMNWVLQYHARLRAGGLLDMADGNRLMGNVAHEVLARFLAGPLPDSARGVRHAVAALLDDMTPAIASPLLLPGRVGDREDLRRNTIESAVALVEILDRCKLKVVATERPLSCRLDDGTQISGIVDLELATKSGKPAVVDLKWSNSDRYRRAEIAEARPIQLATYARLLQGERAAPLPPAAYFMLKQRRLLAVDADPFPPQFRIDGSELGSVWQAVVEARDRNLRELAAGRVTATGVAVDDAGAPEETREEDGGAGENSIEVEPPCRFCSYGRLCGVSVLS